MFNNGFKKNFKENFPKDKNIFHNNNSLDNKAKIENVNIISQRKIKLRPINLRNFDINKEDNKNQLLGIKNNNILINNINNPNNVILRNNNSLLFSLNLKKKFLTNSNTNNLNNDYKTKFSSIDNPISPNDSKKNNFFKKNFLKKNRVMSNINLNKNNLSSDNLSFSNSLNENENKIKKKIFSSKSKSVKNIFISNINIRSDSKSGKERKSNIKKYKKKWELPKVINFDKITGRYKENKNPIKHHDYERMYDYSPNYDFISFNDKKAYVKLGKDNKNNFKKYKINITRKYLYNHRNIINNSGDFYNILRLIKEEKEKKDKIKAKLERNFSILEEYNYFIQNRKYFTINIENRK